MSLIETQGVVGLLLWLPPELDRLILQKRGSPMNEIELLRELLSSIPPRWDEIRAVLSSQPFSKEELAGLAIGVADNCFCEYADALNPEVEDVTPESMHSNHLLDSLRLLLEYGLDSNTIVDEKNVIWELQWVDAPSIAASALRLLLENGGNPNLLIPSDDETLFEYVDFKVSYDEYTHDYFPTFQFWLVLMAYGGCWKNGEIPLTMLHDNKVEIFKNFELYDYEIEPLPQEPGKYGCWIMHVFNSETHEEVARYD